MAYFVKDIPENAPSPAHPLTRGTVEYGKYSLRSPPITLPDQKTSQTTDISFTNVPKRGVQANHSRPVASRLTRMDNKVEQPLKRERDRSSVRCTAVLAVHRTGVSGMG